MPKFFKNIFIFFISFFSVVIQTHAGVFDVPKNKNATLKNKFDINCDLLIAGGGIGGTMAAISGARMGVDVCIFSETDWLGGMLTSAGVSGIDGRSDNLHGIFSEFVKNIEKHYENSNENLSHCTVSYLCFEPKVGDMILKSMVKKEKNIRVFYNARFDQVLKRENKILGFVGHFPKIPKFIARGIVTIDATDFGDIIALGEIPHDLGFDEDTNEETAQKIEKCIQPLTYTAIVKEFDTPQILQEPPNYNKKNYLCSIPNKDCPHSQTKFSLNGPIYGIKKYASLPNGKFLLNIPSHSFGNDFHATAPAIKNVSREKILERAKNYTLGYLYYLQTVHGMKNLGLTDDFDTKDKMAKTPYVRESRRIHGIRRLKEFDILPNENKNAPLEKTGIAVGSYPIDLHFCEAGTGDLYKKIEPYQIPYEVLVPEEIDGFLAGTGRNISVSHVVNGTTRLQQVESYIGQAAGVAASLAILQDKKLRDLNAKDIQNGILAQKGRIIFTRNIEPDRTLFVKIQKLLIAGVIKRDKEGYFFPDEYVTNLEADIFARQFIHGPKGVRAKKMELIPSITKKYFFENFSKLIPPFFHIGGLDKLMTKKDLVLVAEYLLNQKEDMIVTKN